VGVVVRDDCLGCHPRPPVFLRSILGLFDGRISSTLYYYE